MSIGLAAKPTATIGQYEQGIFLSSGFAFKRKTGQTGIIIYCKQTNLILILEKNIKDWVGSFGRWFMAQLVDWSLPTPAVRGSDPAIGKFYMALNGTFLKEWDPSFT